ncbi:MAG: 4-amino-4-deoxychorismate lyase [Bacteroidetes bacterium ADurb.Bin217]|nr:MAG: 4-amino-4-deoxychorismate lyase [Bacteroidetes bacterium ADurb.Bin217]
MNKFYIEQGELHKIDSISKHGMQAFTNALHIHEQIRLYNTVPLFLDQHLERITKTLQTYTIAIPNNFDNERIQRYITRLLNVNKVYKGGVCSIHIFPDMEQTSWRFALFIDALPKPEFSFNTNGWHAVLNQTCMQTMPYTPSICSWHMAWQFTAQRIQTQQHIDAVCFVNEHNQIVGSSQGDIVLCNDTQVQIISLFPSPLAHYIAHLLEKNSYSVSINTSIAPKQLELADEIFIINPIDGIRWVSKYNNSIYRCIQTKKMWQILVKQLMG